MTVMVYMRRKPFFILLLILGIICLVDSGFKKDMKEFFVGLFATGYAIVTLVGDRKKKRAEMAQKAATARK